MIYFVRHGETDFNLFGVSQGQLNTSLNRTGLKQAKNIAKKLKNYEFDFIFSSPITRAVQTTEIINTYHKKEVLFDDRLKEGSRGILEGYKNSKETLDEFSKNPHKFKGEDCKDIYNRAKSFLKYLQEFKNKKILIVSHGRFFKHFELCFKNLEAPEKEPIREELENCEIVELEF